MDILLILGSVTAKQYEPLRLAMLDKGIKAKIYRVREESNPDFFDQAFTEWERTNGSVGPDGIPSGDPWIENRVEELRKEAITWVMQDAAFSDIKAILFQKGAVIDSDWLWFTKEIHVDTPCYRVEQSESDDSQYLSGRGFGKVLDVKK